MYIELGRQWFCNLTCEYDREDENHFPLKCSIYHGFICKEYILSLVIILMEKAMLM